MQKNLVRIILIFTIALPSTLSFSLHDSSYDILSEEDWSLLRQEKEKGTPALSSAISDENKWESYNEWRCFSAKNVEALCASVDDDDSHLVPIVTIQNKDGSPGYEYALGSEYNWNCNKVIESWSVLIENQESICIHGAYLQEDEQNNNSLWYIDQIKTQNGYWKMENYYDFLSYDE
ncbi:MAG: hypothetical protein PHY93_09145 [Bacteriovorax sp.]|nr:hypothetical protein [Bacteriovorax sp.]